MEEEEEEEEEGETGAVAEEKAAPAAPCDGDSGAPRLSGLSPEDGGVDGAGALPPLLLLLLFVAVVEVEVTDAVSGEGGARECRSSCGEATAPAGGTEDCIPHARGSWRRGARARPLTRRAEMRKRGCCGRVATFGAPVVTQDFGEKRTPRARAQRRPLAGDELAPYRDTRQVPPRMQKIENGSTRSQRQM